MSNVNLDRQQKSLNMELLSYSILGIIAGFVLLSLCVWDFVSTQRFGPISVHFLLAAVVSFLFSAHFFRTYRRRKLLEEEKHRKLAATKHQG